MDFDLGTKISLQELSSVLEQELLGHEVDNAIYQVAIYSCRHEMRYMKGVLETESQQRDKMKEVRLLYQDIDLLLMVIYLYYFCL